MKIYYGLSKIKKFPKPVVAMGVFDGMHLGHRQILKAAVEKARSIKGTSIVLTFWPHPQKEESLYSLKHRLKLIEELGIDVCIVLNFNRKFAAISTESFVKNILVKQIGSQYIFVGENFRFGKNASGDCKTLKRSSLDYNFKLKIFSIIKVRGKLVSSTHIRGLIKSGKLQDAKRLLIRPVSIFGTVIEGDFIGRKLGFPTANIDPHHEVIPPDGVYAVKVILDKKIKNGICYIGTKPTFTRHKSIRAQERKKRFIEAHIFNFRRNIYGKDLEIQFLQKIREDKKFKAPEALITQINKDITFTKHLISRH